MRGITGWHYKPYSKLTEMHIRTLPFLCRVVPFVGGFEIQWFDNGQPEGEHKLLYRGYTSLSEWTEVPLYADTARVEGLIDEHEYELKVVRADGTGESGLRLVRTGFVYGTVVNYLHPEDKTYSFSGRSICSPTIAMLPNGDIVTAMDVEIMVNCASKLLLLFKSTDGGKTWRYLTDIYPGILPTLFTHRGKLYLLAMSQDYGDLLIGRSDDGGETWTIPTTILSGNGPLDFGTHCGPMPTLEFNGRLYHGIEYGREQKACGFLSIDANADLLDAGNWSITPFVSHDTAWQGVPKGCTQGSFEGNAVVAPDGVIRNYLRMNLPFTDPQCGKALVMRGDNNDPEAPLTFDRIVDCPLGSNSKFVMRQDPSTKKYIMIGTEQGPGMMNRLVLSMAVSDDFYTWKVVKRLIDFSHADPGHVGYQYPDWLFDGDDILMVLRVAFGRSFDSHDVNFQCFYRIENFRQYFE